MENIKTITNEELIDLFENANFNQGFVEGQGSGVPISSPKETYEIKEEILNRLSTK